MKPASHGAAPSRRALGLACVALAAMVAWRFVVREDAPAATPRQAREAQPRAPIALPAAAAPPAIRPAAANARDFARTLAAWRARFGADATARDVFDALSELARADAPLAIDLAHALGRTGEERNLWVTALAESWTTRSPQQAWDWLSQQDPDRIRTLATGTMPGTIIGTLARGDAGLLLRNLDALVHQGEGPLGVAPVVAVHLALDALGAADRIELARDAVEAWAAAPHPPAIGEAAFVSVAAAMSRTAPEDAGRWLRSLPASAERDIALVEFPAHWAQWAPAAALDWAAQHVPPELRGRAIARALSDWIERSPADAGEWLGGHLARTPPGAEADGLVGAVINLGAAVRNSPATALQWVNLISDPAGRRAAEERVVLRWGRQDRAAAMEHLWRSPTIAPERKQALLLQMQRADYLAFED